MKQKMSGKVIVLLFVMIFLTTAGTLFAGGKQETNSGSQKENVVTITVTSWRTEDSQAMDAIHKQFEAEHPNIRVKFEPVKNTEYYAQLGTALESGTNVADVITLHGYGSGYKIYKGGYLKPLKDIIPELDKLSATSKAPWAADGTQYGVPWIAVSHGFYYNKGIFDKYGLKEPKTWAEFIKICDTLKKNGETVIAMGSKDAWTLNAMGYCNFGCNFYGGEKSRQALMAGEMKVTDKPFVKAFEVLNNLKKYFPKGYQALDYVSTQQMFVTGQAAIFPGGSWEIGPFKNMGADFEIGWFPPPVEKKGDTLQYCWSAGAGLGMYKDTPHPQEVITYLRWMLSKEASQSTMNEIPGFYVYLPGDYKLDNSLAQEMVAAKKGADLTERLTYEKLSNQEPAGTTLFYEAEQKMINGDFTPMQAAEHVQKGLETWYKFK